MTLAQDCYNWTGTKGLYYRLPEEAISEWEQLSGEVVTRIVEGAHEAEGRWCCTVFDVYKFEDDSYIRAYYDIPATEMQECDPDPAFELVEPREVTVTQYFTIG